MKIRHPGQIIESAKRARFSVLSIDFFDTIVYRRVLEPNDVFRAQYKRCQEILGKIDEDKWVKLRKSCEEHAAKQAARGETDFENLYRLIAGMLSLSEDEMELIKQAELDVESEVIEFYPFIVTMLRELMTLGVSIVVLTDTYLPSHFIRGFVDQISTNIKLMCSSETQAPKRNGAGFRKLRKTYSKECIFHVGDNLKVDVIRARKVGIRAGWAVWGRTAIKHDYPETFRILRSLGITNIQTPFDYDPCFGHTHLAFIWSLVLACFCCSLRDYAIRVGANDIWFLSRDCETIFSAAENSLNFFALARTTYVLASRSACHPLAAIHDLSSFEKWYGRSPSETERKRGIAADEYYRQIISNEKPRIVIVDMGWKGRFQSAMSSAFSNVAEFFGFYFSLEPGATATSMRASHSFFKWTGAGLNRALVEALAGYSGPSLLEFRAESERVIPVFKGEAYDAAPEDYRKNLLEMLSHHLSQISETLTYAEQSAVDCERLVKRLSFFPRRELAHAMRGWGVSVHVDGHDKGHISEAGAVGLVQRIIFKASEQNPWPFGSIWTLTSHYRIGLALQYFGYILHSLRSRFHKMIATS